MIMQELKKILIIDDSAFMRRVISDIINSDSRCIVVGTAKNGKEGLERIAELNPDVITLDIEMPVMDGLEMLEQLMKINPKPVIILSAVAQQAAIATLRALELGAIDFITKPQNIFKMSAEEMRNELLEKIFTASRTKQVSTKKIHQVMSNKTVLPRTTTNGINGSLKKIIAIGTSTGGPRALQEVLPFIPGNIPVGIIIVQHMPPGFTKSLAERLDGLSQIRVKEAEDRELIRPGTAYIAPGDFHVVIEKTLSSELCICLSSSPPVGGHRPSVNVMMNSLSDTGIQNIIGVIMTGMGSDGCEGILNLKNHNNAHTIAQDEKSCVVYGMPKAIVEAGVADKIVPLSEIANEITKMVGVY